MMECSHTDPIFKCWKHQSELIGSAFQLKLWFASDLLFGATTRFKRNVCTFRMLLDSEGLQFLAVDKPIAIYISLTVGGLLNATFGNATGNICFEQGNDTSSAAVTIGFHFCQICCWLWTGLSLLVVLFVATKTKPLVRHQPLSTHVFC
jgi:hypothetical protein